MSCAAPGGLRPLRLPRCELRPASLERRPRPRVLGVELMLENTHLLTPVVAEVRPYAAPVCAAPVRAGMSLGRPPRASGISSDELLPARVRAKRGEVLAVCSELPHARRAERDRACEVLEGRIGVSCERLETGSVVGGLPSLGSACEHLDE